VLYRAALRLCPPAFRREFSSEMIQDFEEARREAAPAGGTGGLWRFRARMLADVIRTLVTQWLRTGWPWIVALAIAGPLAAASGLARLWQPPVLALPAGTPDAELISLALLISVIVLVIATTIILTLCFTPRVRPRNRR
jgi:hypothetical protein